MKFSCVILSRVLYTTRESMNFRCKILSRVLYDRFLREIVPFFCQISVFHVKLFDNNCILALNKVISRKFDPLMNNIRILYLTKGLGKYKILIPCEGKNYFPLRPKGHKILSLAAYGRSGKYFWPLLASRESNFYPHLGWVFHTYPPPWWSIPYTILPLSYK